MTMLLSLTNTTLFNLWFMEYDDEGYPLEENEWDTDDDFEDDETYNDLDFDEDEEDETQWE